MNNYKAFIIFLEHWVYDEATPKNEVKSSIGNLRSKYDTDVLRDTQNKSNLGYRCKTKQKRINNINKRVINCLTGYKVKYQYPENFLLTGGFINMTHYNELFYNHDDEIMREQFYKKMVINHFDIPRISKYREYLSKIRVLLIQYKNG